MTLSLFVLRHGKSDWSADHGGDHERPLKRRGERAARRMGRLLSDSGNAPQLVLSSSATRAQRTAELASQAGEWACEVRVLRELYGAGAADVLALLQSAGDRSGQRATPRPERVLVVGHEPTCSELVGLLGDGPPPLYPTAALARIDLGIPTWSEIQPGCGRLAWLIPPRALGDRGD